MNEFHTKNFALHEFTDSGKAKELGIDNTKLSVKQLSAIANLVANVLQPARDILGVAITVTSGFRCKKLNAAIGGVSNSQHMDGEAADLRVFTDKKFDVVKTRQLFGILSEMNVDQLLYEKDSSGAIWVHVSYVSPKANRNQIIDNYMSKR